MFGLRWHGRMECRLLPVLPSPGDSCRPMPMGGSDVNGCFNAGRIRVWFDARPGILPNSPCDAGNGDRGHRRILVGLSLDSRDSGSRLRNVRLLTVGEGASRLRHAIFRPSWCAGSDRTPCLSRPFDLPRSSGLCPTDRKSECTRKAVEIRATGPTGPLKIALRVAN